MEQLLTVAQPGMVIGAVYALTGLGIVLAMRVTRVVNLAQGDLFIVGAFVASTALAAGLPAPVAVLAAVAVGIAVAAIEEVVLLRRMRGASQPILLLTTVAFALTLQGVQVLVWGRDPRTIGSFISGGAQLGGVRIGWQSTALIVVAVLVAIGLSAFLDRSTTGRAMAAVAEDPDAARMTGIDVFRLRLLGLAIAGAIGALAGALALPLLLVDFTRGLGIALRGFVAAVAGGTSVVGTLIAGLALGVAEAIAVRYLSSLFSDVIVFGALVVVVLALPHISTLRGRMAA